MKHLTIILFSILVSCKNNPKTKTGQKIETETEIDTQNGLDQSVYEMWNDYIASNPEFKNSEIPETEFFHNTKEDANRLAELTLNGKKKATSSLFSLYKQYGVDLPKVGAKQIITDFDGKAKAIIENVSVDTIPFNKVSKEYAELDMGTGIEPLEKWKKAHWDFFESFLAESGEQPTEEMLMVCVKFKTIWPENR